MLRIIGGELRRRKIHGPPESATTRPITDLVREAVFNILRGHFEGASVYDGFAGTGTIGLEAVSRGASRVVFAERDRKVVALLERNIDELGVGDRCEVVSGDALGPGALGRCPSPVDVVFLDPPYAMVRDPEDWQRVRLGFSRFIDKLSETGFAVLRTPWPFSHETDEVNEALRTPVDLSFDNAVGPETHAYGSTAVHLYMRKGSGGAGDGA